MSSRNLSKKPSSASTRPATQSGSRETLSGVPLFEPLEGRQLFSAGLQFNFTYDAGVNKLSYANQVKSALTYVANEFHNLYSNNMTVNVTVNADPNTDLGGSTTWGNNYTYAQVKNALNSSKTSTNEGQAYSTLPSTDPTNGATFFVPVAEQRALGLRAASDTQTDGTFRFGTDPSYSFDSAKRGVSGRYDFIGVAEHEISEIMGRISGFNGNHTPFDLFRDRGNGVRSTNPADTNVYFSIDNGQTKIKSFNSQAGGDISDWASGTNDAFNAFSSSGVTNAFSTADKTVMDTLGYHPYVDDITTKYSQTAGMTDFYGSSVMGLLGTATGAEKDVNGIPGARMRTYHDNGAIVWGYHTGAHVIYGGIGAEWTSLASQKDAFGRNAQAVLGLPTSEELNVPGVSGARYMTFQYGAIYWSEATGGHTVMGGIYDKYKAAGGAAGYGLPTSDELPMSHVSGGRVAHFTGGRDIVWTSATGGHLIYGGILSEYNATANQTDALGRNLQSILGAPTSDEMNVPGFSGARMNTFQGGKIFWSDATGAHAVYGAIGDKYAATGGMTDAFGTSVLSILGLPTSDEQAVPGVSGARVTHFQGGDIYWSAGTGAHVVYGDIGGLWNSVGGARSFLGMPTSDEQDLPGLAGGRVVHFQFGNIAWTPSSGAFFL